MQAKLVLISIHFANSFYFIISYAIYTYNQ